MSDEMRANVDRVNSYLATSSIPEDVVVYRALQLTPEVANTLVPGATVQNPGFTPTTLTPPGTMTGQPSLADQGNVRLEIFVPKGTKNAAFVSPFLSNIGSLDREVLFGTDMNFRVDAVEEVEPDGQFPAERVVYASVVPSHSSSPRGVPRTPNFALRRAAALSVLDGKGMQPILIRGRAFGGEGSGPKPGVQSPWYERGSKGGARKPSSGRLPVSEGDYKGYVLGDSANPPPEPKRSVAVSSAAVQLRARVAKAEPAISRVMIDLADAHRGELMGMPHRLKSEKSLARKIEAEAKLPEMGGDVDKAADAMGDVVRYTMNFDSADYVEGVQNTVRDLESKGYTLRVKNYWGTGDPYQGINVAAVDGRTGTKMELQFHTPESYTMKGPKFAEGDPRADQGMHKLYEKYRESTDPRERWKAFDSMERQGRGIPAPPPPDVLATIGIPKWNPFTPR